MSSTAASGSAGNASKEQRSKASSSGRPPRTPKSKLARTRTARTRTASAPTAQVTRPQRSRSVPTTPTRSAGLEAVVREGKLVHVRVTLGYLKALTTAENVNSTSAQGSPLVTAYAALDSGAASSDHDFAPSMPLNSTSELHTVVWPKPQKSTNGVPTNKSRRRLYFSTTLQKDDVPGQPDLRQMLSADDDVSAMNPDSESFSPELINIELGVVRGEELLPLGVATLVVNGKDMSGKQMELPVRTLPSDAVTNQKPRLKRRGSLKRLFSRKASKTGQSSFAKDKDKYGFTPNAILRIRLDVSSENTSLSGPLLWGDADDDDNDSFGPIIVLDLSTEKGREEADQMDATNPGCESIEVVDKPHGTTIISAHAQDKPSKEEDDTTRTTNELTFPIKSVTAEEQPLSPRNFDEMTVDNPSPMLCGMATGQTPLAITDAPSLSFDDSSTIATSQYNGTRGETWKRAAKSSHSLSPSSTHSGISSRVPGRTSLHTVDEMTAEHSGFSPIIRSRCDDDVTSSDESNSLGEDTVKSLTAAKRVLQKYAKRAGVDIEDLLDNLEVDSVDSSTNDGESLGQTTIGDDSIHEAKSLLQRYAKRVGVNVEDLLNDNGANSGSFESAGTPSTTAGSRSEASTSGSTEYTEMTKSTTSRFSLFLS